MLGFTNTLHQLVHVAPFDLLKSFMDLAVLIFASFGQSIDIFRVIFFSLVDEISYAIELSETLICLLNSDLIFY